MRRLSKNMLYGFFIGIQLAMYITFILLDYFHFYEISNVIKFITIVLCFFMSLGILIIYERNLDRVMLCIALSFTVLADVFLLFTDNYIAGVSCFCIVQSLYLLRIANVKRDIVRINSRVRCKQKHFLSDRAIFASHILLRVMISAVIGFGLFLMQIPIDALLWVTIFYFISFVCNIAFAFSIKRKSSRVLKSASWNLFLIGLVLFLVCDLMVGLFNMTSYVPLSEEVYGRLYHIASVGMWVFYLPGQVLITLS